MKCHGARRTLPAMKPAKKEKGADLGPPPWISHNIYLIIFFPLMM